MGLKTAEVLDFTWDVRPRAACHPDRPRAQKIKDLCIDCVNSGKRAKKGIPPPPRIPERIPGVEQRAVTSVPDACPKCRNRMLLVEGRCISCRGAFGGCGLTLHLVST